MWNLCIFVLSSFYAFLKFANAHHGHHHPFQDVLGEEDPYKTPESHADPMSYEFKDIYVAADHRWDYNTIEGPLHWARHWPLCRAEPNQSPINIPMNLGPGITHSKMCKVWPENPVNSFVMVNDGTEKTIKLGPLVQDRKLRDWELIDIHFHTPSEHRYNDEHYPAEAHFVLKSTEAYEGGAGRLMVRGIFFDVSDTAPESDFWTGIAPFLSWVQNPGDKIEIHNVNTRNIMRIFESACRSKRVYHYTGSLTTPPCSTNLSWHVLSQPLPISISTYKKLRRILKFNARYTQNEPERRNILAKACCSLEHPEECPREAILG